MQKAWTPPLLWVFAAATLLGCGSTLQAHRLMTLTVRHPQDIETGRLLLLNLAYWYIPAALTPAIFRLAHRFRIDTSRWRQALGAHLLAASLFSVAHVAGMLAVRALIWDSAGKPAAVAWTSFAQRIYLQNLDWALMTYAAIAGLSYALRYNRESQARALRAAQLETQLIEARLRTLETELHPHFLFNTLHAISALVHSKPETAEMLISRLGELLRLTFDQSGAHRVSVQEELDFLRKYLEIEQTRFQDRLIVRFDVEADTLDAEVPRLILQPLVENAIKHGISPRAGRGLIQVAAHRSGSRLLLEVRDDDIDPCAGGTPRLQTTASLATTRDRLECLYGDTHHMHVSESPGSLSVRLEIPFSRVSAGKGAAAGCVEQGQLQTPNSKRQKSQVRTPWEFGV